MEGESIPPHSEMEAGNMNPEAVPVKSLVGYGDEGPDGHHQNDQAEMDQGPSFSNGNGNGASEEEPKEEPKSDSFDLFGSMISKMPAKPADEEKEKEEVKNEDDSNEEKKDSFDKMFDSVGATNNDDKNEGDASGDEEKKDSTEDGDETKPEGEESTKDVSISEENEDNKREYDLPYDWKKLACRRGASSKGNKTWDIYIIAPCGKKLRSNPEIEKYLSENPDVEVDRDVTNTSKPSELISSGNNADSEDKKPFESGDAGRSLRTREAVTKKDITTLLKSPRNFVEENISEAFKTLEVYQKALETERTRCIKSVKEGMSVDTSTSITRKLRKLYAVTQKNMDLLDRAIVESFVENFPTESTRIHMGRVAPAAPPPVKRGAAKSKKKPVKGRGKVKIKPKKGKPAAKGRKKGVIELNGAPDYVEYDLPASAKKKRKSAYDDDAEVIDLSEEDDEYYNPKKRSRPGPASSKKGKPGPASKKRAYY